MTRSSDSLSELCLKRLGSLIELDQKHWKNYLREGLSRFWLNPDGNRRRCREISSHLPRNSMIHSPSNQFIEDSPILFVDYLSNNFRFNPMVSEKLVNYLSENHCLNDFTLNLFSGSVFYLRRLSINLKYLTPLSTNIIGQHPHLVELQIICKDSPLMNRQLAERLCPPRTTKLEEIYSVYGGFLLRDVLYGTERPEIHIHFRTDSSRIFHHDVLNNILSHLDKKVLLRLKRLAILNYKRDQQPLINSSPGNPVPQSLDIDRCYTRNLRLVVQLKNLTVLNLNSTDIENDSLELVIDHLKQLENLDLSSCRSLTSFVSLLNQCERLNSLNLYNCPIELQSNPSIYEIFYELRALEYLDISLGEALLVNDRIEMCRWLERADCLTRLKHFDISGRSQIPLKTLRTFLVNHPRIEFLGLYSTDEKDSSLLFDSTDPCYSRIRRYTFDLRDVMDDEDLRLYEPFVIESLRRYQNRIHFLLTILDDIFLLTRSIPLADVQQLVEIILKIMTTYRENATLQLIGTACVFNLTRKPSVDRIHRKTLDVIVRKMINLMENFPHHAQLYRYCLSTLNSERIMCETNFQYFRLAMLTVEVLQIYTDFRILEPALAVLSMLTSRFTVDEFVRLSSFNTLRSLVQIIELHLRRLHHQQNPAAIEYGTVHLFSDDTLRFALNFLRSSTDENCTACEALISAFGLQLCQQLCEFFSLDTYVLTKTIGVLGNIAQVIYLKISLYSINILSLMQRFLEHPSIQVSFLANTNHQINRTFSKTIHDMILRWPPATTKFFHYRTYKPFLSALFCHQSSSVQLWALWSIEHLYRTDHLIPDEKLCSMLRSIVETEMNSTAPDVAIQQKAQHLLEILTTVH